MMGEATDEAKYREAILKILRNPEPQKALEDLKNECPVDVGLILSSESMLVVAHWGALEAMATFAAAAKAIPGIRKTTVQKLQTAALMAVFQFITITLRKHKEMGPSLEERIAEMARAYLDEPEEEEDEKPETVN